MSNRQNITYNNDKLENFHLNDYREFKLSYHTKRFQFAEYVLLVLARKVASSI